MINLFPDVKAPNGMAYAWKRVALEGEPDTENLDKMQRDGWRPVPNSRHPEIDSQDARNIVVGGLALCERPADVEAAARRAMTKAADDAYNAAAEKLEGTVAAAGGNGNNVLPLSTFSATNVSLSGPSDLTHRISAPRSINGVVVYPKNDDTEGTLH